MRSHRLVLWWVPEGHVPDMEEAKDRLDHLNAHGNTDRAFGWPHLPHVRMWQKQRMRLMDRSPDRQRLWNFLAELTSLSAGERRAMLSRKAATSTICPTRSPGPRPSPRARRPGPTPHPTTMPHRGTG